MFHSFTPYIEIVIIAIMMNYLLSFFWKTRSRDLIFGMLAFLLILAASSWLKLPILHQILILVSNVALIAIIIIFQPELRAALSKLSLKGRRFKEFSEFDRFLDQLATSIYRLSEKRIGALIVLEHEDILDEFAAKAVMLESNFTSELLETIFAPNTPLHDGAVIIRQRTIVAAAVILPLAEEGSQLTRSMGTRHRAALGLSQQSDALIISISEETGKVSIAREGVMTRGVKIDRLKGIIRSIFTPPPEKEFKGRFNFQEWLRR
ncbi:MAG: Cyclic di-AMP synthase CdaA [Chlamydiae bacterium]|nr:Cyclic di-AMP synthase CdaA [Chlamydiota bacterium]